MEITMGNRLLEIDGLPVKDAKKSIRLEIMREDIANARKKNPNCCAVAKACTRGLNVKAVKVHLTRLYLNTDGKCFTRYIVGGAMRSEIIAFDRGGKFQPGMYNLAVPDKTKALGYSKKSRSVRKDEKGKPKLIKTYTETKNIRATAQYR
jgi:hypothetical protein